MANDLTMLTGFVENQPSYFETTKGKIKVAQFNLVVDNDLLEGQCARIGCCAYGDNAEIVSIKGLKGSLWTFRGKWKTVGTFYSGKGLKIPVNQFVIQEAELFNQPTISGMNVKQVLKYYSPTGIKRRFDPKAKPDFNYDSIAADEEED